MADISFLDDTALLEGFMHVSPSFLPKQESKLFALKARSDFPWQGRKAKTAWIVADALQQAAVIDELMIFRVGGVWEMRRVCKSGNNLCLVSLSSGLPPVYVAWEDFRSLVVGKVLHIFDITHLLKP